MIGRRVVASKDVSLSEVSEILNKVSEENLGFEQSKTLTYAKKFTKVSKEDADLMAKELMENDKITRSKAVKIIDLMPQNAGEIKAIFSKETFALSDEEISSIVEIAKKYSKEPKKESKESKPKEESKSAGKE